MTKDCRETALNFLEHRERSTYEVRTHLITKGFPMEEIEEELNCLIELHYLDDTRYCNDYIRYGFGKGRGPVRLQQELSEKGIDTGLVRELLKECFPRNTERDAAMKEAEKLLRLNGIPAQDFDEDPPGGPDEKALAKIGRKLNSLGYHSDVIYDILRQFRK